METMPMMLMMSLLSMMSMTMLNNTQPHKCSFVVTSTHRISMWIVLLLLPLSIAFCCYLLLFVLYLVSLSHWSLHTAFPFNTKFTFQLQYKFVFTWQLLLAYQLHMIIFVSIQIFFVLYFRDFFVKFFD